jgi:hypothetical protein
VKVVGGGEMYYRRIFDLFIFIAFMVIWKIPALGYLNGICEMFNIIQKGGTWKYFLNFY